MKRTALLMVWILKGLLLAATSSGAGLSDSIVNRSGNWQQSSWLGWYWGDAEDGWIYHSYHGWLAVREDAGVGRLFFWDRELRSWLATNERIYPSMFHIRRGEWVRYVPGSFEPRVFFTQDSREWLTAGLT